MMIAVIGSGGIGSALATLFARHGHEVVLGARDPERAAAVARETGASGAMTYRAAAAAAEVLFFCIPWEHGLAALSQLGDLTGKVLVDVSNPEAADGRSLALGHSSSGAETIAAYAPGATVVKAFNYIYAELLRDQESLARLRPSIFLCGADGPAKETVSGLIASCGLEAIDCGPLENARYLEPLALLMVQLVRERGWGPSQAAMKLAHG